MDTSTINHDLLATLPRYKARADRTISTHLGMGCYLEPPGHPSYFLQSVYTPSGNAPRTGPQAVLLGHVVEDAASSYLWRLALCDRLYVPLPFNHPRVQRWLDSLFRHFRHCYYGPYTRHRASRVWIVGLDKDIPFTDIDHHMAVRAVRRWYPDFEPDAWRLHNPRSVFQADCWWERDAVQPSEAACPGHLDTPHGRYDNCRYCGREEISLSGTTVG